MAAGSACWGVGWGWLGGCIGGAAEGWEPDVEGGGRIWAGLLCIGCLQQRKLQSQLFTSSNYGAEPVGSQAKGVANKAVETGFGWESFSNKVSWVSQRLLGLISQLIGKFQQPIMTTMHDNSNCAYDDGVA